MADTPEVTTSPAASSPPSSAAEQARIRKERREAKIRAGGSARLNKITGLGGGVQRDPPPQPSAQSASHADPEEVDISNHYYETKSSSRPSQNAAIQQPLNDAQLRQMMLGLDPSQASDASSTQSPFNPFNPSAFPGMEGAPNPSANDPMLQMLQQLMGGIPGEGPGGMPSFPGMSGTPGQETTPVAANPYAYLWRVVHAIFALSLGLYIAITTPFTGTRYERESSKLFTSGSDGLSPASVHFFWIFATAEMILQTSRFFLEKGRVQQAGILGMVINFLPMPWKGYVELVARYARIWTTVSADAMVCVFVLGVCAWARGEL